MTDIQYVKADHWQGPVGHLKEPWWIFICMGHCKRVGSAAAVNFCSGTASEKTCKL